jgi:chromate transporter
MIRQELVDEERWVSSDHFNRALAVYQVLPGPEAHELCVYLGMIARGRIGGVLAGLGFMLPGLLLMLGLSWLYVTYGIQAAGLAGAFYGMQAVVGALIVRAIHRIGSHTLKNKWLWGCAVIGLASQLLGVHFAIALLAAGLVYVISQCGYPRVALLLSGVVILGMVSWSASTISYTTVIPPQSVPTVPATSVPVSSLFGVGLRGGLLTFGGAYTVIPHLQHDAVVDGGWMSNAQFLDGIALSGILPAPLVIVGTFVGYLGGGLAGALAVTAGIFLPAFAFTLFGHHFMERLIAAPGLHNFLDGVTAGVVGLIAGTTLWLLRAALVDVGAILIFVAGVVVLFQWKSKLNVPLVVIAAALVGWVISSF